MLKRVKQSLSLLNFEQRVSILLFGSIRTLLGFLDILGMVLIALLLTQATQDVTNSNINDGKLGFFLDMATGLGLQKMAIFALFIFVLKSIFAILIMRIMTKKFAVAETEIATNLFNNFLYLPISEVSKRSKPDYIFSLTNAASFGITGVLNAAVVITSEFFLLIAITITFAIVDLKITLIILTYFLTLAFMINRTVGLGLQKTGNRASVSAILSSKTVEDAINSYREIFTLKKQNEFIEKFHHSKSETARANAQGTFLFGLPRYLAESALLLGIAGLIFVSLRTGNMIKAAETLGIFITGSFRIMASMLPLQGAIGELRHISAQADRFFELVSSYYGRQPNKDSTNYESNSQHNPISLEVKDLTFRFPDKEIEALDDVSFSVKPGSMVAVIGPSGSGKSTLADIIVNLIKPDKGYVRLTNQSNRSIGYVPQTSGMISGTILENITFSFNNHNLNTTLLDRAIKYAHLKELIDSLPEGINTDLGAQSDALSGGQIQRISLARSLYFDPGLLILDEATSALDAETELAISESLESLRGNCTIVVIAHRLSTVKNADVVFVMNEGQIVAQGKFDDLARSNEMVARYVQLSNLEPTK